MHPLLNHSISLFNVISTLYLCMLLAKWHDETYLQIIGCGTIQQPLVQVKPESTLVYGWSC
jgi:hypothetical protein